MSEPQTIPKLLSKKKIAITGSTGFLGTALVERLLRSVPDCELILLVRPGRRGPQKRVAGEILNNDAFDRLRSELGKDAFLEAAQSRITAIGADIVQADLGLDREATNILAQADIFIHSAAAVSFSSPIDLAIQTNLLGPLNILATLQTLESSPHLIAVSTAYVAGNRKGHTPETLLSTSPFNIDIDIKAETEFADRARSAAEDESRSQKMLDRFSKEAKEYLGSAGISALSKRREQIRKSWVQDTLVEAGRYRAASLGFPDIYGLTKAMAETTMCEYLADHPIPLSLVRPSIIESALSEPHPGWIRGFRMAEPIIISYARGFLRDFPARPEGILDVIPVDMVVSAICATAAKGGPPQNDPQIINVASGSVNPFLFEELHDWCHDWFTQNPVYDEQNKPIPPPRWSYPSRSKVEKQLKRLKRSIQASEKFLRLLPIRGRQVQTAVYLEDRREHLERALGYVELYGMYLECEAIFGTEKMLELYESLSSDDQKNFPFNPQAIDWHDYITRIHLPSVMVQGRIKTQPSKTTVLRGSERLRKAILSPNRQMAVFDLENTLIASNVVSSWGWLATRHLSAAERTKLVAKALIEAPNLLSLDKESRGDFLRHFYKRFKGASVKQLQADSQEMFSDLILTQSFPAAIRRVREHKALGHRTLLITGALDFVVAPLQALFDDIICAQMKEVNGHYTGQLKDISPTGELRAEILRDYAAAKDIDPGETVAYADSVSDIPMLEAVGFPVAVNPEIKLAIIAKRRGWLVEDFARAKGGNKKFLPIGPQTASAK